MDLTEKEFYEILSRIERKVDRLDERSLGQGDAIVELKGHKNKSTWALITALTSILGTGALLLLSFLT